MCSTRKTTVLCVCLPIVLLAMSWTALAQGINELSFFPIITFHPESGVHEEGTSVTLRCQASNANLPIQFTHNGALIDEDDPGFATGLTSYSIRSLNSNFEGEYVCLARNQIGNRTFTVASAPAFIQLQVFVVNLYSSSSSSPYNVTTTVGQPVLLNCASSYTSVPAPSFDWELLTPFSRPISDSDTFVAGLNGSLYIQQPQLSQSGYVFECSLNNGNSRRTGYVRLIVQASSSTSPPPHLLSGPTDMAVPVTTQSVTFECIVGGDPLLQVSWISSNRELATYTTFNNKNIIVQAVASGTFTCSVPSLGNFSASLEIIEVPRLSQGLPGTTQVLTYGDSLSLSCTSDGRSISWYWFRNGIRLTQYTGNQLQISSVVEEDTGSYQCYAINDAGRSFSSTYVQVQTLAAEIEMDLPPQQVKYRNIPVEFSCTASGAPPPTYQWLKEGTPLSSSSGTFIIDSDTGSLQIVSPDASHSGQYTCRATNQIGNRVIGQAETSTELTVIDPTMFTRPPIGERTLSIQLDTSDTLFCEVTSDSGSALSFSWTKDGANFDVDSTRLAYVDPSLTRNGSIRITNVQNEDAGVYVCTVNTMYNGVLAPTIATNPITVTVDERPVAPTPTMISSPSSTSVTVVWMITSNLNRIRHFTIDIRPSSMATEDSWISEERSSNAVTSLDINELLPFTRYDIRIRATYVSGDETYSEIMEVVTMEALPEGPPEKVTIVVESDTELRIFWQPPSTPNGVITSYTVVYRLKSSPTAANITVVVNGNTTSYIAKNLKAREMYSVLVAASNSIGMSEFSTEKVATTSKGGLAEPQQGPFYTSVWFIVVVIVVIVTLIVFTVIVILVIKYKSSHRRSAGKYHVRPQSGYFGGGSLGVGDMTDDVANDYFKRPTELNAFGSPTNSENLDAVLERETIATTLTDHSVPYSSTRGTPHLPNATRYAGFSAPEYINPPSFAEATRSRKGSRSSRPHSGGSQSDWSASGHSKSVFVSHEDPFEKGALDFGPDSSYSVQTFSDGESEMTDATEYSHLAGAGQFPRTYHHLQVQTRQNATLV